MEVGKYLFFLGGYDAEMAEIRTILEKHDRNFLDKKLSWGTSLSACQNKLKTHLNILSKYHFISSIAYKEDM